MSAGIENRPNDHNAPLQPGESDTLTKLQTCLNSAWDAIAVADGLTKVLKKHCVEHGLAFPSEAQDLLISKDVTIGVGTGWLLHVSGVLPFERYLESRTNSCRDTAMFVRAHALQIDTDATHDPLSVLMSGDIVAYMHSLVGAPSDSVSSALQAQAARVLQEVALLGKVPNVFDSASKEGRGLAKQTSSGAASSQQRWLGEQDLLFLCALLAPAGSPLGGAPLDWQIDILVAFLANLVHAPIESSRSTSDRQLQALMRGLPSGALLLAFERLLRSLVQEQEQEGKITPALACTQWSNPLDAQAAADQRETVGSSVQSALSLVLHAMFASTDTSATCTKGVYFSSRQPEELLQLALRVARESLSPSSANRSAHCVQRAVVLAEMLCDEGMKSGFGGLDMAVGTPQGGPASAHGNVMSAWLANLFALPQVCTTDTAAVTATGTGIGAAIATTSSAAGRPPLSVQEANSLCAALRSLVPLLREDSLKRIFLVVRTCRGEFSLRLQQQQSTGSTESMDALLRAIRVHLASAAKRREALLAGGRGGASTATASNSGVVTAFHSRGVKSSASGPGGDSGAGEEGIVDALREKVPAWVQAWQTSGTLPVGVPYFISMQCGGGSAGARKLLDGLKALLAMEPTGPVSRDLACTLVRAMGAHMPPLVAEEEAQLFCETHSMTASSSDVNPMTMLLKSLRLEAHVALCRELRGACAVLETAVLNARSGALCSGSSNAGAADGSATLGIDVEVAVGTEGGSVSSSHAWGAVAEELVRTFEEHARAALVLAGSTAASTTTTTSSSSFSSSAFSDSSSKATLHKAGTVLATFLQQLLRTVAIRAQTDATNEAAAAETCTFIDHYMHLCRRLLRVAAESDTMLRCLVCCIAPATTGAAAADVSYVGAEAALAMNSGGLGLACLEFPACAAFLIQVRNGDGSSRQDERHGHALFQSNRLVVTALNWLHAEGLRLAPLQAFQAYRAAPLTQLQAYIYLRCVLLWTSKRVWMAGVADPLLQEEGLAAQLSVHNKAMEGIPHTCWLLTAQSVLNFILREDSNAKKFWYDAPHSGWLSAMDPAGPFLEFARFVDTDRYADSAVTENTSLEAALAVSKEAARVALQQHGKLELLKVCGVKEVNERWEDSLELYSDWLKLNESDDYFMLFRETNLSQRQQCFDEEEVEYLKNLWPALFKLTSIAVSSCPALHLAIAPDDAQLQRLRRALVEQTHPMQALLAEEDSFEGMEPSSWAFEIDCKHRLSRRAREIISCALCILPVDGCRGSAIPPRPITTGHFDSLLKQICADFACIRDAEKAQVLLETALGALECFRNCHEYSKQCNDWCPKKLDIWRHKRWLLSFRPSVSSCLGYKDQGPLSHAAELTVLVKTSLHMAAKPRENASFPELVDALSAALSLHEKCFPLFENNPLAKRQSNVGRASLLVEVVRQVQVAALRDADVDAGDAFTEQKDIHLCEYVDAGLGWCLISFFVALNASAGILDSVLECLFPRNCSHAEEGPSQTLSLLVETLCSCLVHMDRGFGLFSRSSRPRNGIGNGSNSSVSEQGLACSCVSSVLPILATYLPPSHTMLAEDGNGNTVQSATMRSSRVRVREAAGKCLNDAGVPAGVLRGCLDRLDESMDIYL